MVKSKGRIYIGTSGWVYEGWKDSFYPEGLAAKDFMPFYVGQFKTTEINTSFYHLPDPKSVRKWAKTAPNDFVFSIKASRYITHMKRLKDPKEPLKRFFTVMKPLGKKAGPYLFQLPPSFKINLERLELFLKALGQRAKQSTIEFRHQSWLCDDMYDLLRKYGVSLCISDLAGFQTPEVITGNFVYWRLHGPEKAYQGSYKTPALKKYARKFQASVRDGYDVYCYFDNDQKACAPHDAKRLIDILEK